MTTYIISILYIRPHKNNNINKVDIYVELKKCLSYLFVKLFNNRQHSSDFRYVGLLLYALLSAMPLYIDDR